VREEIRLSITRQVREQMGTVDAATAGLREVMLEAKNMGWIDDQIGQAVGKALGHLATVEDRIAEIAYLLTDADKRHTLSWIDDGSDRAVYRSTELTVLFPRPIVCVLRPELLPGAGTPQVDL